MKINTNNFTKYPLLIDSVAKKIFKSKVIGKEYASRIVSIILNVNYQDVYDNIRLISEEIATNSNTVNSRCDVILEEDALLVNIEINYFNGPTRNIQMNSYIFQLFIGQIKSYKDYPKVKQIIQIIIEDQDFFKKNDFVYTVAFMDKKYHIEEDNKIGRFRINLDYLSKMTYTDIGSNELAYLLYPFVCGIDKLNEVYDNLYKDDDFMKKVIKEAKDIAEDCGIKLYFPLTEEEIRKLDEQYFIEQGIEKGIEKNKREMIINFHNENVPIETIAKSANLSVLEVQKIIDSSQKR